MKKIVLVSTFCNNEEKQNVLKETVTKVKEMGMDVMVISPNFIQIKQEIIELTRKIQKSNIKTEYRY